MKGRNQLQFNQATMIAAVQHYLDTVLLKDPGQVRVDGVGLLDAALGVFKISTTDEPVASGGAK